MIITSKIIWRGTPITTISPAQPFHLFIAALHQHHNVICPMHHINTLSLITLIGRQKTKGASLISKQTVTAIFLHSNHSYLPKKGSSIPAFFFFLHDGACFFIFHKAFSKDDRPFTSSTAVTRDLRANPHLHLQKRLFYLHYYRVPPWTADVFLRFSHSIMINLPFIYLLYSLFTATLY